MDKEFFIANRKTLASRLPGELFILAGATQMQRRADAAYPFEQEASFWYLTGVDEPDWWLIYDSKHGNEWLVAPELDDVRAIFEGSADLDHIQAHSGVSAIINRDEAESLLSNLSDTVTTVYTLLPSAHEQHYAFHINPAQAAMHTRLKERFGEVKDCRKLVESMRAIKQPAEIEMLQKAIDVSINGITGALSKLSTFSYEYEFEAELNRAFRLNGAQGHAYDPIIAVGKNACTLHYQKNAASLVSNQWLLFDVGARYGNYCADITRSVPLGQVTERHRAVYESLQRVHDHAVTLCKPGQSVEVYHQQVMRVMGEELVRLKLINNHEDTTQIHTYFPHAISHGLGIDVHDPLGRPKTFTEDMVLTVEPGIYIPEEELGVRLENDIHITRSGPVNMSAALPSDIDALVKLVG